MNFLCIPLFLSYDQNTMALITNILQNSKNDGCDCPTMRYQLNSYFIEGALNTLRKDYLKAITSASTTLTVDGMEPALTGTRLQRAIHCAKSKCLTLP